MYRLRIPTALTLLIYQFSVPALGAEADTVVTFGGSSFYPPFHYELENGTAAGFDSELFRAIGEVAGWTPEFRFGDWERIQEELAAGAIDLVPMFVSPERRERYLFSDPINIDYHLLFGPSGSTSHRELNTLAGLRVAAENGAFALQELRRQGIGAEIMGAESEAAALRLVADGAADLAFVPSHVARYTIASERLENIVALSPPLLPVTYAFAINPQRPDLVEETNAALIVLQGSGVLRQLRSEWLEPGGSGSVSSYFLWIILPLAGFAVFAAAGLWRYRHEFHQIRQTLSFNQTRLHLAEKRAQDLAGNDVLTALPQRQLFLESLEHALTKARERFGFLLEDLDESAQAVSLTQTLIDSARCDYEVKDVLIQLQVSSGLVFFPSCDNAPAELLRKAKLALKQAQIHNDDIVIYAPAMEPDPRNLILMSELKKALHSEELSWVFQPQYGVKESGIIGAEMLVRWRHLQHGWIPPDHFIPLAEQTGLIKNLSQKAIRQATRTLQQWREAGMHCRLSINVSAKDLGNRAGVEELIAQLAEYGSCLTLEITETALMEDFDTILGNVELLKKAQVKLALDDYGTGYSSLAYLKELNFDGIKIDKKFIKNISHSRRDLMLTEASIRLGQDLGARVVAEGVEDVESARILINLGCDCLQGYGISKPLFIDDFMQYVESNNVRDLFATGVTSEM